jgi:CRISPR-associated exonuclease Cas4
MNPPDYVPISMLNQLLYCERRFWLMYVCGELDVNAPMLEGTYQHRRAHRSGTERDGSRVIHRRVYLWSDRLRVAGFADLVEEEGTAWGLSSVPESETDLPWFDDDPPQERRTLVPVEYKHGKRGQWANDQVQLCAQAFCLEERTGLAVERGEIFYWRSRRRVEVLFTPDLRAQTETAVGRAFALLARGVMPPPIDLRAKCRDCSLEGICLPREVSILAGGGA